ncbi:MAG: hypothetical protein ACI9MD_002018, partial [Psychrobacter glaciei]
RMWQVKWQMVFLLNTVKIFAILTQFEMAISPRLTLINDSPKKAA